MNLISTDELVGRIGRLVMTAGSERQSHIQAFVRSHPRPDFDKIEEIFLPLIKAPLKKFGLKLEQEGSAKSFKKALQYVLNYDEHVFPRDGEHDSITYAIFDEFDEGYMFEYGPNDLYLYCEWIWRALYDDEDWHTDITIWPKDALVPSTVDTPPSTGN